MSSFSVDQFEIDFAEYLDLFNIRRDTTDQDIAVAITTVMTSYDGEARFDPPEAEAYFKAQRDNRKHLAELWIEDLPDDFLDTASSADLEAALEVLGDPRVIDDLWDGEKHQ